MVDPPYYSETDLIMDMILFVLVPGVVLLIVLRIALYATELVLRRISRDPWSDLPPEVLDEHHLSSIDHEALSCARPCGDGGYCGLIGGHSGRCLPWPVRPETGAGDGA